MSVCLTGWLCGVQEADGDFELPEDMQLDEGEPDADKAAEDSGDEAPPEAEGLADEGAHFKEAEPEPATDAPEPAGPEGAPAYSTSRLASYMEGPNNILLDYWQI